MASKPAASTVTKYFEPLRARSILRGVDPITRSAAAAGILAREVEVAGHVVAGAGRDDAEAGAAVGHGLDPEVDHPVATDHDERLEAVGDALARQVERLVGVAALEVADHEPSVPEPGQRGVPGARALALAGRGVRQERDLARVAGHAQTLGHECGGR